MKILKTLFLFTFLALFTLSAFPQDDLTTAYMNYYTSVKDQGMTGTCWSFATVALLESEAQKNGYENLNISEMFIVRNIYLEKAFNYILRLGSGRFEEGAMGHDVTTAISKYGAMTEDAYSGLKSGRGHDHSQMLPRLKNYLDRVLKKIPIDLNWEEGFIKILDEHLGAPPEKFIFEGKEYTPLEFAADVLKYNPGNYINITSFTHHPFYKPFIIEVPDNFSGGEYYNVPLDEMILIAKESVMKGYTVLWDADVSNENFLMNKGFAMEWVYPEDRISVKPDAEEKIITQDERQNLFENLTTQDDHLMQFVGIKKSEGGKDFFLVKNSWNEIGKYNGFLHASESYFALNTIAIIVVKDAIPPEIKTKLGLN
ncbi:MAG: aminopeptidase [Ignavibacteria bacterium]|nr:aminopeptidase [Ignavibacteria bacterium]